MENIRYTTSQISELKSNKYVKNCTSKNIIFTKECKIKVVELSNKGIFNREIFKILWFPEYIINSRVPELSVSRWKRNTKDNWLVELNIWRPKKEKIDISKMNKDEYIEYLEAKLALTEELKNLDKWKYP